MLLFKKKFLDAIRERSKTQTIRLWGVCRMKAGQRSYIPGAGYIRVLSVDRVEIAALTDDDARPDGFPTAEALRAEIEAIYAGQLATGHHAYRIRFELLSDDEQAAAVAQRRAAKADAKKTGSAKPRPAQSHSAQSRLKDGASGRGPAR